MYKDVDVLHKYFTFYDLKNKNTLFRACQKYPQCCDVVDRKSH